MFERFRARQNCSLKFGVAFANDDLREMGDSLRSNAERLLRDVQMIHSRMLAQLDRLDGGLATASGSRAAGRDAGGRGRRSRGTVDGGEVLDVPEFIPPE